MLLIVLIVIGLIELSKAQHFDSPCPSLFTYEPEGVVGDRWYGNIRLTPEAELSGVWLRVIFDRAFPELGSDFGEVVQREPSEFLIRRPKHKVPGGQVIPIRIFARFDETPPQLLGFRLNGNTICPENGMIQTTTPSLADLLVSPCPNLFEYEPPGQETDRWYGTIQIKPNRELSGVWLRVILDRPSIQLGVSDENWFGEVKTDDNIEYLIKNRDQKVKPGEPIPLRFFIKYNPSGPVPRLAMIKLNAAQVCPETNEATSNTGGSAGGGAHTGPISGGGGGNTTPRPERPLNNIPWGIPVPGATTPSQTINGFDQAFRPILFGGANEQQQCGMMAAAPRPLITHGQAAKEGQWPWHAAIYYAKDTNFQYICGGTLISLKHVLTAAHCVLQQKSEATVPAEELGIFLGKYQFHKYAGKNIQNIEASKILMHPGYNHYRAYMNDIAMITLSQNAEYTDWVRPACLWADSNDISSVIGKEGTVVGWGYDENRRIADNLAQANMPVVSHLTCIRSFPEFFAKFANEKTYCAGFRNGTSVCNGDSGGGMVFPKQVPNSKQVAWQIRGIVSLSVAIQTEASCDTSHYAIFTDVAKYLDWIRSAMIN